VFAFNLYSLFINYKETNVNEALKMIAQLIELVFSNVLEVLILLQLVILIGQILVYIYWKDQVKKRDTKIKSLDASIKEIDVARAHQYAEIMDLNRQLKENKHDRIWLSQQINEKVVDLERDFKTQLENREKNIQTLNNQINEKNASINLLQNKVTTLEKMNQESENLLEQLNTKLLELEKSVEEKMLEVSSINSRMSIMQDDLTHIVGIGPKVSSVLREAGINNFTKLGSINLKRLNEILEAENPNILRLIDPSTWPEQAKLASTENWEALSNIQESIKNSRPIKQ
jgi:predicted flap endonuclease-1-like 5' DNA nuclease